MAEQTFTPLSNTETAAFCSQMAMILHSGISTLEGVSLMLEDTKEQEEIRFLTCIEETLQTTGNFQEALSATGAFPAYMLHMVQIGEYSGRLDEVMEALSVHYKREAGWRCQGLFAGQPSGQCRCGLREAGRRRPRRGGGMYPGGDVHSRGGGKTESRL